MAVIERGIVMVTAEGTEKLTLFLWFCNKVLNVRELQPERALQSRRQARFEMKAIRKQITNQINGYSRQNDEITRGNSGSFGAQQPTRHEIRLTVPTDGWTGRRTDQQTDGRTVLRGIAPWRCRGSYRGTSSVVISWRLMYNHRRARHPELYGGVWIQNWSWYLHRRPV